MWLPAVVFVGALAAPAPPAPAQAGKPVRVLIWPERGTTSVPEVEAAVARDLRTRVPDVALPDALPPGRSEERQRADEAERQRVEAALAQARSAYLAFDFAAARAAVAALLEGDLLVMARQPELLGRALVLAAQVELAAGSADAALAHLRFAVRLGQPADPATIGPPELARLFADAKREAQTLGRAPLKITSQPAGATVTLDGAEAGVTPLVVDVGQGRHLLLLELPGRREAARVVTVASTGASEAFALDEDADDTVFTRLLFAGRLDAADPASRAALLERAHATHLATYRQTFFGPEFQVRPLEGDPVAAGRWRAGSREVADRIADVVLGVRAAPAVAAVPPVAAESAPWWRRGWVWATVAGAVVVAGGVAAYVLVDRPDRHAIVRPL